MRHKQLAARVIGAWGAGAIVAGAVFFLLQHAPGVDRAVALLLANAGGLGTAAGVAYATGSRRRN